MSEDRRVRKPLLEGRGVWPLDEVCAQRGVRMDQLVGLIEQGALDEAALYDECGRPVLMFEDLVPDREEFARLLGLLDDQSR